MLKKVLIFIICFITFSLCAIAEEPYYAVTNKKNVNMRIEPNSSSRLVMQIRTKGTKLTVHSSVQDKKGNIWLQVETQKGKKGYIQSTLLTRTEGKPIIKTDGKFLDWSDAYNDFILGRKYRNWRGTGSGMDERFYEEDGFEPVMFSLYDMDKNGIPELLGGGNGPMAGNCYHVFSFENGEVKFCGNVGFESCTMWALQGIEYNGLFCHDGKQDIYVTVYYSLADGKIQEQPVRKWEHHWLERNNDYINIPGEPIQLTSDSNLFNATFAHNVLRLMTYTRNQIQTMGWEKFTMEKCIVPAYVETWVYPGFFFEILPQ